MHPRATAPRTDRDGLIPLPVMAFAVMVALLLIPALIGA
jgi:hypothetical protein